MRLIDYKEIRKLFNEEYKKTVQLIHNGETRLDSLGEGYRGADKVIRELPDVDAVEVVRCKNCGNYNKHYGECNLNGSHFGENGFCSCGAKMNEGENL